MSINCQKQKLAENNCLCTHNKTQHCPLYCPRNIFISSCSHLLWHRSLQCVKSPSNTTLTHSLSLCVREDEGEGHRWQDRRKKKRKLSHLVVCAFKEPQARAVCWESQPVLFSWPLRGGLLPSGSMTEMRGHGRIWKMTAVTSGHQACLCSPERLVSTLREQIPPLKDQQHICQTHVTLHTAFPHFIPCWD